MDSIINDKYIISRCIFPFLTYKDLKYFKYVKQFLKYFRESIIEDYTTTIPCIESWNTIFPKSTGLKCNRNITDDELLKNKNYNIINLNLSYCSNLTNKSVGVLFNNCKKLKYVNLNNCKNLTDDIFINTNIQKLLITGCNFTTNIIEHVKNLELLNYSSCDYNIFSSININNCFNQLRTLIISFSYNIENDAMILISEKCKQLEYLDIDDCIFFTDKTIQSVVRNCKQLENLNIKSCNVNNDTLIELAKNCKQLNYLNMRNCHRVTNKGIIILSKNCKQLKYLNISECFLITINGILSICNNLQKLNGFKCEDLYLNDKTIYYINKLENLEVLNISNNNITGKTISKLNNNHIKLLSLYKIDLLNDKYFNILTKNLKNLKTLELNHCENVTDKGIKKLTHLKHLNCITMSHCDQVTDKGIISLSKKKDIIYFDLHDSNNITDKSIISIVKYCKNLQTLYFNNCMNITDKSIFYINKHRNLLREIEFTTEKISPEAIKSFMDNWNII